MRTSDARDDPVHVSGDMVPVPAFYGTPHATTLR